MVAWAGEWMAGEWATVALCIHRRDKGGGKQFTWLRKTI